jgi:hypothetical protein
MGMDAGGFPLLPGIGPRKILRKLAFKLCILVHLLSLQARLSSLFYHDYSVVF